MNKSDERVPRVIHVRLTDREWKELHAYAFESRTTKGEVAGDALRALLKGAKP